MKARRYKRGNWREGLTASEAKVRSRRPCPNCGTTNPRTKYETFREDITFCPLHRSAQDMLDALIFLVKTEPQPLFVYGVIKRAEGRP